MASFKTYRSRGLAAGATATQVGGMTVTSPTVSVTAIGLSIANTSSSAISVTAYILDTSSNKTNLAYNIQIPVGSTLVLCGNDQKVNLIVGDALYVQVTSSAGTADVVLSTMEQ